MTRSKSLHWYWGDVPCQSVRSNLEQRARRRGTEGIKSDIFRVYTFHHFFHSFYLLFWHNMFQLGLYSAHSWGVYMPLQANLGLSLHLVRSHEKHFDAKTMQKHIWWWTRSCDIVWTLAMAQVHPLILSGLVYNVTLFAIWSCLQHHLRLQNSTKWLTQV